MRKGIFGNLKDQTLGSSGEYVKPGTYWFRLDEFKYIEGRNEDFVGVVMTCVHSFQDGEGRPIGKEGYEGHKVGDEVSYLVKVSSDYFKRDVKRFLHGVTGFSVDEIDEEHACQALGFTKNYEPIMEGGVQVKPLDGMYLVLEVQATDREKKKGEGTFTTVNWKGRPAWKTVKETIPDSVQARYFTRENGSNAIDEWMAEE